MDMDRLLSVIEERQTLYQQALSNAKAKGDVRRARRMDRGLKELDLLKKKVKEGSVVDEDDIPPPVVVKQSSAQDVIYSRKPAEQSQVAEANGSTRGTPRDRKRNIDDNQSGLESNLTTDAVPDGAFGTDTEAVAKTSERDDVLHEGSALQSMENENSFARRDGRQSENRKEFDAVLVYADDDCELADSIMEGMNKMTLRDGSSARVVLYDDTAFGGNIIDRPSVICEKSFFIFIVHTKNVQNDKVAEFTKQEAIAQTRLLNLFHDSESVRSLINYDGSVSLRRPPNRSLAAVPPIYWNEEDESAVNSLRHLIQYQRDEEQRQNDGCGTYCMKEKHRGLCLIINNVTFTNPETSKVEKELNRISAEWETEHLKCLFEDLGYEVLAENNLEASKMEQLMKELSDKNYKDYDSFLCFLLSHGKRNVIYGCDCKEVRLDELLKLFHPDVCPSLRERPKLFFIDACRTEQTGLLDSMEILFGESPADHFYICYSTSSGELSRKDNEKGDWFTNEFMKALTTRSKRSDLIGIMEHVKYELSQRKMADKDGEWHTQRPDIINTLKSKFYFAKPDQR